MNGHEFDVQERAVSALGSINAQHELTIPALIAALAITDEDRERVEQGLVSTDPPLAVVAAGALGDIGAPARAALPALSITAKEHPLPEARVAALEAIARIDRAGKTAIPLLAKALRDDEHYGFITGTTVREQVLLSLSYYRQRAKAAIPVIVDLLRDKETRDDVDFYGDITLLLADADEENQDAARDALPLLREDMRRELADEPFDKRVDDARIRAFAAGAIARISGDKRDGDEAIAALVEVLSNAEWNIERLPDPGGPFAGTIFDVGPISPHNDAARALARLGPTARSAATALKKRVDELKRFPLYDMDYGWALASVDPTNETAIPALREMIHESDLPYHWRADDVLRILAPHGEEFLSDVVEAAIVSPDSDEWPFWRSVIDRYRPDPKPALIKLAAEEKQWDLLAELGQQDLALEVVLKGDLPGGGFAAWRDDEDRAHTAQALGKLGHAPEKSVPALLKLLEDERVIVRVRAAEALGKFGPRAADAKPALEKATRDDYRTVREAAAAALKEISAK